MKNLFTFLGSKNPDFLQEEVNSYMSSLKFHLDESYLFEYSLRDYLSVLSLNPTLQNSKKVKDTLLEKRKELQNLFQKVQKHHNELSVLIEGIDETENKKNLKVGRLFNLKSCISYHM